VCAPAVWGQGACVRDDRLCSLATAAGGAWQSPVLAHDVAVPVQHAQSVLARLAAERVAPGHGCSCARSQRGEPSPTTGWQGVPAFVQCELGAPLLSQPDAAAAGWRLRGEVRPRLCNHVRLGGACQRRARKRCTQAAKPRKESMANDDGCHWRK
jgi:hypothetical protein